MIWITEMAKVTGTSVVHSFTTCSVLTQENPMPSVHRKALSVLFPSILGIELVSGEMPNQIRIVQTSLTPSSLEKMVSPKVFVG